ncbi:TetR/AcrR family transcriptional regulator [Rosenbergiella australiborealis]|uniref:TetR/AcrR family transcriptional regulator n=1 Tax=Rosenbergiella australiborealis TaxID=1544696 RepID=A0ABS5T447_9GAMM|nr:TetR/AcrR family transcriptional regulator [Rosenbergiella australiborealis]MBT0727135.1 TetR/AcrR family transcriptional regulator [Rosenbergiella australiborealis]
MMENKALSSRQQQRKEALIAIARQSFQQNGLHGTTLAVIAKASALSVGQIYRLFTNKEEIIEAVVNQIICERVAAFLEENHNLDDKAERLAAEIPPHAAQRLDDALLMEINAESLRNPRLLAILQQADQQMKTEAAAMIRRQIPEVNDEYLADSSELIAIMVEGIAFRRIYPQTPAQRKRLMQWYQYLFREIKASATC